MTRSKVFRVLAGMLLAVVLSLPLGWSPAAAALEGGRYSSPQSAVVYVDDDFTASTPGWGIDHFAVIQDGVNAVAPGGTVNVAGGSYAGQVVIDRDLTLLGVAKTSVIYGVEGMPTCFSNIYGESRPAVCLQGDVSATIEGFGIEWGGEGPPDSSFRGIAVSDAAGIGEDDVNLVEIANNHINYPISNFFLNQGSVGIEVDAGYGSGHLSIQIHHNEVIGFDQAIRFHQCNPSFDEVCGSGVFNHIEVISNNLFNDNVGISIGMGIAVESQIHYNRIFNDLTLNGFGLFVEPMGTADARYNWWGCNDGPGVFSSCVRLDIPWDAFVQIDPFLVLALTPPPPVAVGQTIPIKADLTHTFLGEDTSAGGTVIDGIEINFSAFQGSVGSEKGATLNGVAATTYTAPDESGEVGVCAQLDVPISVCTYFMVYPEPLELTDLDLLVSTDPTDPLGWQDVPGSLADGFKHFLDPSVEFYYLDSADLVTSHPLKDGLYPFFFDDVPDGFFDYWIGRGVVEGASGWQGVMWEIINKQLPIFYLKVNGAETDLVDGLLYELKSESDPDPILRINGSYLPGAYTFQGSVEDIYGFIDPVNVGITFFDPLALSGLSLLVSTDPTDPLGWQDIPGTLADGFELTLNPTIEYYYLDAANITVNRPLKDGLYPFNFGDVPDGFYEYWADRGVFAGAAGWQGTMWQIINNELPVFYLKVEGSAYDLIDGLQFALGQPDQPLRIDGGYLSGGYTFTGEVSDDNGYTARVTVGIKFDGKFIYYMPLIGR